MGPLLLILFFIATVGGEDRTIPPPIKPENESIEISFAGDVMMGGSIRETMMHKGVDYPFTHVRDLLSESDYAAVNLETAVTEEKKEFPKLYNFKADPSFLDALKGAGFDIASLANNHTMDYREQGLLDTMNYLNEKDIKYFGAGRTEEEAYDAAEVTIKGKKVKFLGFSHVLPDVSWYAGENKPGLASGYQLSRMIEAVQKAKDGADYVLVYIHWGKEREIKPLTYQRVYAKAMIEAGADGIVGSHPHVLQGFEYYKEKPIAYSLGNFLFPNYVRGESAQTGILKLSLKNDDVDMSFDPYYIKNDLIVKQNDDKRKEVYRKLEERSFGITISKSGKIERKDH